MLRRLPARGRSVVLCTTLALVGTLLGAAPATAAQNPVSTLLPDDDIKPPQASGTAQGITNDPAPALAVTAWQPTAPRPHVVLVSSGVDTASLPGAFHAQVTHLTTGTDVMGYGTWAAASILQAAPEARISSVNVYPSGALRGGVLRAWLDWLARNHSTMTPPADAVLLAFPQSDFADPVSVVLDPANGPGYRELFDTIGDRRIDSGDGVNLGTATAEQWREDKQLLGASAAEKTVLRNYNYYLSEWRGSIAAVRTLTAGGVPVVAPAGDLGGRLQSIAGLANLPDVVTVGAALADGTGFTVAGASSSGPGLDGSVKPDVLAPVATAALVPAASDLAEQLTRLVPSGDVWPAAIQETWASAASVPRGWVASSLGSAALVATGLAGLRQEGVGDVATMRGALIAAAEPLAGVPAWRQGAGVLTDMPDRAFAESRALVTRNASLGVTPATGTWAATLPVTGGTAGTPSAALTDFAGFGAHGETVVRAATTAPPVAGTGGAAVALTATSGVAEPGLYCGYTTVPLPGGAGTVTLDERVPTCLVQGMAFYAESRYIHNEPAEDVTYELLPALPPQVESLAERPMAFLPLDPAHLPLYVEQVRPGGCVGYYGAGNYPAGLDPDVEDRFVRAERGLTPADPAVVDSETCAVFPAVPPGYYQTRLFANYSSPVTWNAAGGPVTRDIGERAAYQKLPMWILPSALDGPRNADGSGANSVDGGVAYRWDKTTNTWVVGDLESAPLRFVYGHLKRIVGTNVSSRVVDLLDYDGVAAAGGFSSLTIEELTKIEQLGDLPVSGDLSAWRWSKSPADPTGIDAAFNPLHAQAAVVPLGVMRYPINLATPNYLLHASLNFRYRFTDTIVWVAIQAGDEISVRRYDPKGEAFASAPAGTPKVEGPWGTVSGDASIEFDIKSKGAAQGYLWIVTEPTAIREGGKTLFTSGGIALSGISVQYDTWTNATWPQVPFCPNHPAQPAGTTVCPDGVKASQYHVFSVTSGYTARQVVPGTCRTILAQQVCEDWALLVHAPRTDARLHDVRYGSADPNDPHRASVDVSEQLARHGAFRYTPDGAKPRFVTKHLLDVNPWTGHLPGTLSFRAANPFNGVTNNRFWDDVLLPLDFVTRYPGEVAFRIENNHEADSRIVPRGAGGAAPVGSYVCYVESGTTVGGLLS